MLDLLSSVCNEPGPWLELVDGGAVDWTQKLLSSAKTLLTAGSAVSV